MDLNTKNNLIEEYEDLRIVARDLYDGAFVVKKKANTYLYRTATENAAIYNVRLKRAVYDNWPSVVVGTRASLTWRKSPIRENFGLLETYIHNVDGNQISANSFFKQVSIDAAVDGIAYVLISNPATTTDLPISLSQEKQNGLRPVMTRLLASQVLDWQVGEDGKLDWIVIGYDTPAERQPGEKPKILEKRLVWYRDRWESYVGVKQKHGTKTNFQILDEGKNSIGIVPIIPFFGVRIDPYFGLPVTKDILDHTLSLYNKFSDRDFSEYLSGNPIPYIIARQKPDAAISVGHTMGVFIKTNMNENANIGYLEPTGAAHENSRKSERDLVRRIYEVTLQQAKKDSLQVQDDDTLRQEAHIFNSSLMSVSIEMERSETQCWQMFSRWLNQEFQGKIIYNKDFDDKIIEPAMVSAFSNLVEKYQISKKTFLDILKRGEILPHDLKVDDELKMIELDLENEVFPDLENK